MGAPYAEVIGDPIAHSKSPLIHEFWLRKLGLDYEYHSRRVPCDELPAYFALRRRDPLWCGSSVTLPHKQAAVGHMDRLAYPAGAIGAVNAVTREGAREPRLIGHNTDALGFLDILQARPMPDSGFRLASLIGTGGAAAALAWALTGEGFLLIVYSRSAERGAAFQRRFAEPDLDLVQPLDSLARDWLCESGNRSAVTELLINATPLGMRNFPPLPLSLVGTPPDTLICDLVYDPVETELLRRAREHGHPVIDGFDMLIAQAARAFPLFFAEKAPRQHDEELREVLTR